MSLKHLLDLTGRTALITGGSRGLGLQIAEGFMEMDALVNFTRALAACAPLKRIGGDEDLKGGALLFASDAGRHITGQILAVDGGASAH